MPKPKEVVIGKLICHTKCYYMKHMWNPGDEFEATPEIQPNQYFSKDGLPPAFLPRGASSDSRSTKVMRDTLKKEFGINAEDMGRKEAYRTLVTAEAKAKKPKPVAEAAAEEEKPDTTQLNKDLQPHSPIILGQMTADEIDALTKKMISEALDIQYGIKMPPNKFNKEPLMTALIQEEAKLTDPAE